MLCRPNGSPAASSRRPRPQFVKRLFASESARLSSLRAARKPYTVPAEHADVCAKDPSGLAQRYLPSAGAADRQGAAPRASGGPAADGGSRGKPVPETRGRGGAQSDESDGWDSNSDDAPAAKAPARVARAGAGSSSARADAAGGQARPVAAPAAAAGSARGGPVSSTAPAPVAVTLARSASGRGAAVADGVAEAATESDRAEIMRQLKEEIR